ncbi:MAG: NAD(P)H-binding protein [Candidatus Eremiobacteraeota bacterium]|nr:NAD(P)H-binding protein [Candidatus Eremiobacteraeota bacterium]
MRLTIFGVTGGIGSSLVEQALAAGHTVDALVRNPNGLKPRPALTVHSGDILNESDVRKVIRDDTDAVLSAFAARASEKTAINQAGTANISRVMETARVRRFIGISASAMYSDRYDNLVIRLAKPVLRRVFKSSYEDLQRMESDLRASNIDWSLVVPPRLTDKSYTGHYHIAIDHNVPGAFDARRSHVADCMLRIIGDASAMRHLVFVGD